MIVSIHQPNFLPWAGYFHKIANSDIFVLIDNVQFVKGHIINRNKIKNDKGQAIWLTVPVKLSKGSTQKINEIEIDYSHKWQQKHVNLLRAYYYRSKYFKNYINDIREIIFTRFENLAALNITLIKYICEILDINTTIFISSELKKDFGNAP